MKSELIEIFTSDQSHYSQILEGLPVAIYTCNEKGYIQQYNKAAVELWGREPKIGKDLWCGSWKIYHPDGSPLSLDSCPMAIALKEGRIVEGEEIIIERADGTRRNVTPYPQPIFDDSGKLIGAVNTLLDVTDHKINEERTATLAAIVQSSDDAIVSKTLNGIVTSWNNTAERIFGFSAEEMIGQSITKIIPIERADEEPAILERLKKGDRVDHFETKRITKYKKIIDVSLTISPIRDSIGNIIGVSKIARDITQQKNAQLLIRESEERLRMAVESTKLGTWEFFPLTGKLTWSTECKKIYDVPENMEVDFNFFSKYIYPDDFDFAQKEIAKALDFSGTGNFDIQYRIIRYSDQEVRWIRSQGKVYFNTDRQAERFIGTVLDITSEKSAKEKLEEIVQERTRELFKINEQLEKSNHELEQYAYIASHDLQEPLRKIQIFSDLLRKNILNEEVFEKYYDKINFSVKRMSVLINDVLNYSRLSTSNMQRVDTDLNLILQDIQSDLDLLIEQKQAVIHATTLPVIKGIPLQLQQLFSNLISNSIKFCDKKPEIQISSRMLSPDELKEYPKLKPGTDYIELNFKDNGIGFDQEHADKIFIIFQRLNNRHDYSGTGIGLALCKKIVENHDGMISAIAEKENGAIFRVLLPVA